MPTSESGATITDIQEEYIAWTLMPPDLRTPSTEGEWAKTHGLDPSTPYRWKRQKNYVAYLRDTFHEVNTNPALIQEVLQSLFAAAVRGDSKAATAWLQVTGNHVPTSRIETTTKPVADMSDEDLETAVSDELARRRAVRQAS